MKHYTLHATRYTLCLVLIFSLLGCEAFVRKFTRKPKKENIPQEEMVLAPEEYKGPQMSREELYRQYLLFWKSWQDELIESLLGKRSLKKQLDCAEEAIKNLINLRGLLSKEMQNNLDVYIAQLKELKSEIASDLYANNAITFAQRAERIKREIVKGFSYNKIKSYLQ